jgi:hypothetical protein
VEPFVPWNGDNKTKRRGAGVMNLWKFRHRFNKEILMRQRELPALSNAPGWANERVQNTLNLAVSCLEGTGEAYFEVGSFGGKSLEAALVGHEGIPTYACDIEYQDSLRRIIGRYGITFFHQSFDAVDLSEIKHPVGVFYLDNEHTYEQTYNHLVKVMPVLAEKAYIFVDDHAYVRSYNAVRDFLRDHAVNFTLVHEMWPECDIFAAMTNHCLDSWHNGWAIIEYEKEPQRLPNELDTDVLGSYHCGGGVVYPEKWRHIWEEVIK